MTLGYLEEKFGFGAPKDRGLWLGLGAGGMIEFGPFSSPKPL